MRILTSTALLVFVLVSACGDDDEAPVDGDPALAPRTDATVDIDSQMLPPRPESLPERHRTRRDTLTVGGGAPQVVDFGLVQAPPGFAVPFSTYIPENMTVDFDTAGAVHQLTLRGAVPDRATGGALMNVALYPPGTTRLVVEDRVREFVVSRSPGIDESRDADPPSWAEWAVQLSYPRSADEWFAGSAVIAQYGPRYFHVIELYPAEDGDEIGPRFDAALDHWRWDDTGLMLTAGVAGAR